MKILLLLLMITSALFSNELGWSHDYKETIQKAKKSNKLVYILITSDNCKWCRKFESTTLQDKDIQERLYKEFEVVHLSRDRDFIPKSLQTAPVPHHYFLDKNEKVMYKSLGHRGIVCFDAFMDNAQQKFNITQ